MGRAQVSKFVHVTMDFRCTGVATDNKQIHIGSVAISIIDP